MSRFRILPIPMGGGGVQPSGTLEIRSEGTFDVTDYAAVDVDIFDDTTTKTIDENGTYNASDDNVLGYSQVTVNVEPDLGVLNVTPSTQAQVIIPSNIDGWDEVNVAAVSSNIDPDIQPANIRKNVNILGVTGTMEEGITPEGTLNIINNGTYDITNYANVTVQVASGDFNELCFTANEANCTVGMSHYGTNGTITKPTVYYSLDKQTWTLWDFSNIALTNAGDKVYFYGNNLDGFGRSSSDYSFFSTSGDLSVSGNVMTLITRYGDREYLPSNYTFKCLFYNSTITDASNLSLPVMNLLEGCYIAMFDGCTRLTTAPSLPATTLANSCYNSMFRGCTSLTSAPALPATTLANQCYGSMFQNCTSITTAPSVLPATTVAENCYQNMFQGCTSLATAPATLPATTMQQWCYAGMFGGCTSLTTAPELPATTLANFCYNGMFDGCTSLATGPSELPADNVPYYAYQAMFQNCTSLTTAPVIKGTVYSSVPNMFKNCSNLNYIVILAKSWSQVTFSDWVRGVAQTGTFVKTDALQTGTGSGQIPLNSTSGIPTGWTVYDMAVLTNDDNDYITLSTISGYDVYYTTDGTTPTTSSTLYTGPISTQGLGDKFTLKWMTTDNNSFVSPVVEYKYFNMFYIEALENNTVLNLQSWSQQYSSTGQRVAYSTDKLTWASVPRNTTAYTLANAGDKVYFRRWQNNSDNWGYGNISGVTSGTIKIGGCLEYAVYWDITGNRPASAGCGNMFQNCTGLVDASDLVLVGSAYQSMFQGCTSLTTAPSVLPATTLIMSCYTNMFYRCTSLTSAPELPATTLTDYCYREMFKGCTSLVSGPTTLPATSLAPACCQSMFNGCTSLTTAPALPAMTLAEACYNDMFTDCTSLTAAPLLPATTLAKSCYATMFARCTSMVTAPSLPATTLADYCYKEMFYGCTSLVTPPVIAATTLAFNCCENMFRDCTSLTSAPALPATTTVQWAYRYMFQGCTSLTTVPLLGLLDILHPTGNDCLDNMFRNCSSLEYVKVETTTWYSYNAPNWLNGVAATGTFVKPSSLVIGTSSGQIPSSSANGIPTGWTVVDGNMLRFTAQQANSTVALTPATGINLTLYKSTDGSNFTSWDGSAVTLSNIGDTLWVYGNNQTITVAASENYYTYFVMTGSISAAGDATYLFQNGGLSTLPNNFAMCSLFRNCTSLTVAPDLPSTTLTEKCYLSMFNGCTNLVSGPSVLPATSVPSTAYQMMFKGCTSLVDAPVLSATTVSGSSYTYMFEGCTNLVTAPSLPALSVSGGCTYYGMFKDCSSLVNAPSLPATTLSTQCYMRMFQNCTSLVNAPTLPAPSLSDLECCCEMFNGCTSLNNITCLATSITGTDATSNWLLNVAATGTFTKATSMSSWTTGDSGIPNGWTVVDA